MLTLIYSCLFSTLSLISIGFINLNLKAYAIRFYTSSPLDCFKYARFNVKGHSPEWNVLDRDHYLVVLYAAARDSKNRSLIQ